MANEHKIDDPTQVFHYWDKKNSEWLVMDIRDCRLEACDTLWVRTYRARRGQGELIRPSPYDLTEENSLRFPHCPQRLLQPEVGTSLSPSDQDTVWLGLDLRDIDQYVQRDLSKIQFLLIPCSALEAARIPGFEGGCT